MEWQHNVAREWLKERKKYLTASDVVKLLPAYKRINKAINTFNEQQDKLKAKDKVYQSKRSLYDYSIEEQIDMFKDFISLYLNKSANDSIITASPSSAAARGHVLEPYAVEEYNNIFEKDIDPGPMYHWDDKIIYKEEYMLNDIPSVGKSRSVNIKQIYPLSFSPDGLSVKQPLDDTTSYSAGYISALSCLEIKSYSTEKHAKKILAKPSEHEERYQIATAMLVCPTITDGILFFYNPKTVTPCHFVHYDKLNLKQEINDIYRLWCWFNYAIELYHRIHPKIASIYTEKEIHAAYMREQHKEGKLLKGV